MWLTQAYRYYVDSFSGLSREIWILAVITFVNRAGSMVVPFLSLYLTAEMGLSLQQVGWVMSSFGAGSVIGSWLGGKLSDSFGFYEVMAVSLITSGAAFIGLQFIEGFLPFCAGIFVVTLLMDSFRPPMFVAVRSYAHEDNRTRAVTLIRLAINLGFSMGPAIGGAIIAGWSYSGLFWVDGLTCVSAAILLLIMLPRKQAIETKTVQNTGPQRSPYKDRPFLFFLLATVLITIPFLQYFSTIPLFYSEVYHMSELWIGILLGMNGLLIFLMEMPLIKYCEDKKIDLYRILIFSILLFALSFAVLNLFPVVAFLWVGIVLVTVGEMLNFPFMNNFAFERSDKGPPGAYMALFTISWSVAHIIGHTLGLNLIARLGYEITWWFFTGMLILGMGFIVILRKMVSNEQVDRI